MAIFTMLAQYSSAGAREGAVELKFNDVNDEKKYHCWILTFILPF